MYYVAVHHPDRCQNCGVCSQAVSCPGEEAVCYGCGACALLCPYEALEMVEEKRKGKVSLEINGERVRVPERITIKDALREAGYHIPSASEEAGIFAPCAVEVDGEVKPA